MQNDGWYAHNGGACPVAAGELVCVRWRDGTMPAIVVAGGRLWGHAGIGADIVAYKLAEPQKVAELTREFARRIDAELAATWRSIFTVERPVFIDEVMQLARDAIKHSMDLCAQLDERDERIAELENALRMCVGWCGSITFTTNDAGDLISITHQDPPGHIINVLWEKKAPAPVAPSSPAALVFLPDPADPRLGRGNGR